MRKSGVSWDKKLSKWRAQITYKGKPLYIGVFRHQERAQQAVWDARQRLLIPEPVKELPDYLKHRGLSYRLIAKHFMDGKGGTVTEIAKVLGVERSTANAVINRFHNAELIRISAWVKPLRSAVPCPVYAAGNQKDAPSPNQGAEVPRPTPESDDDHWIQMMHALAPRRSMEQVREINRLYAEYMGAR